MANNMYEIHTDRGCLSVVDTSKVDRFQIIGLSTPDGGDARPLFFQTSEQMHTLQAYNLLSQILANEKMLETILELVPLPLGWSASHCDLGASFRIYGITGEYLGAILFNKRSFYVVSLSFTSSKGIECKSLTEAVQCFSRGVATGVSP